MKPVITSLASILIVSFSVSICNARILNVPEEFQTIQAGIDAAENGDTVLVQRGNYPEHLDYSGKLIVISSLYPVNGDWQIVSETIIEPETRGSVVTFANGETEAAAIIGFTLRRGSSDSGGGIYCQNTNPQIIDCIITRNSGNGVVCRDASPSIDGCIISDNGVGNGAGVYVRGQPSNPVITDCQFLKNTAGFAGGGLLVERNAAATVTRCNFFDNTAEESETYPGHAIAGTYATISLTNCTIGQQSVEWPLMKNSAIAIFQTRLEIVNCVLWSGLGSHIDARGEEASNNEYSVSYSVIEGGREAINEDRGDVINWGEGNIDADPLFLDPDNGDHNLTANSPCIDAGDPDSPLDPDGTRADMGAFYFHQRDIEVELAPIQFDTLFVGESSARTISIRNTGKTPLQIEQIVVSGNYYSIDQEGDIELTPNSTRDVPITFSPADSGEWRGNLLIISDDPDEDSLAINLVGLGGWYPISVPTDNFQSSSFDLHSAFPNPFNSSTTIRFSVGQVSKPVKLAVYGLDGRLVQELWTGKNARPSQSYSVTWNAEGLPGGVYLVRLESASNVQTIKAVLMK